MHNRCIADDVPQNKKKREFSNCLNNYLKNGRPEIHK